MTQGDALDFFYHRNIRKTIWGGATRSMLEETADIVAQLGAVCTATDIRPVLYLPEFQRAEARAWAKRLGPGLKIGVNLAAGVPERQAPVSLWKKILDALAALDRSFHVEIQGDRSAGLLLEVTVASDLHTMFTNHRTHRWFALAVDRVLLEVHRTRGAIRVVDVASEQEELKALRGE